MYLDKQPLRVLVVGSAVSVSIMHCVRIPSMALPDQSCRVSHTYRFTDAPQPHAHDCGRITALEIIVLS